MRLKRFLELAVANGSKSQHVVRFGQEKMSYSEVIRRFAEREQHEPGKAYLARITPYAYVAAEMLGADLKILGIYKSAATGENDIQLVLRGPQRRPGELRGLEAR